MTLALDPFPDIPPALLNSADIEVYASRLNVFQPFDAAQLKAASYEIPFCGDVYWWESGQDVFSQKHLGLNDTFVIKRNEIVFVYPDVKFTLPWYLALRFNLHIRLVHRGLLLGTGPLVDPGFEGRLLIPVHNLTSSDLQISGNEGFIWIEVTKISAFPNKYTNRLKYREFPANKRNLTPVDYFTKANGLRPISSTLRSTSESLTEGISALEKLQDKLKRIFTFAAIGGVITLGVSIGALVLAAFSLYRDFHQYVGDSRKTMADEMKKSLDADVNALRADLKSVSDELAALQKLPANLAERSRRAASSSR